MRRGVFSLGALAVVLVLAVVALYLYFGSLLNRTNINGLQPDGPAINILLVGSTTRCGIASNPMYGLCSQGVTGVNSDIVMIAHLQNGKASLLSIPRDLFVPNARSGNSANKIDAALYDTPSQLVYAIEEDFGIPITHYIELNFDTFANVVNAVHGINMYFPMRVFDQESSLNIERPGCYHLDGLHALEVVRARHLQIGFADAGNDPFHWPQEAQSDLARIRRTHEFLRVVAAKISSEGLGLNDFNLAQAIFPDLTVDNGFSETGMLSLAYTYHAVPIASVPEFTYPVVINQADPTYSDDYYYEGYNYGDVEFPIQPGGWLAVDTIFGAKPDQSAWNDSPLPKAGTFAMSVENGTGAANQAAIVAHQLHGKGFDVTATGSTTPVGTTSETTVWYGGPPPPKHGAWNNDGLFDAERVMSELQGFVTLGYNPAMVTPGDKVTVDTGTDLTVATRDWTYVPKVVKKKKKTSGTGKGHKHHKAPVTATTVYDPPLVSSDNNFSAPSDLAQPLEPWDPRACTASMKVIQDG
jgi:LCP family protein required for cell wall assembly